MPVEPPVAASMLTPEPSGAPAPDAPLVLEGIRKRFGSNEVLKGVSLELRRGELLAVLGANGCGKSTLLRCAIRLIDPDAGSSLLCGNDLAALRGRRLRLARREAAVVFQQIALVKQRTALDNVCRGALGQLPLYRSLHPSHFPAEVRERAVVALAAGADARAGVAEGRDAVRRPGPARRDRARLLPAGLCTAFDGQHLYQIAEGRIQKIDPKTGRVLATIPAPDGGGDSGLAWAEGTLWVGQYEDRKIHQVDPRNRGDSSHHRVQPLRHRGHLDRRRALARHLGR